MGVDNESTREIKRLGGGEVYCMTRRDSDENVPRGRYLVPVFPISRADHE